jgi:hypothetical protein
MTDVSPATTMAATAQHENFWRCDRSRTHVNSPLDDGDREWRKCLIRLVWNLERRLNLI